MFQSLFCEQNKFHTIKQITLKLINNILNININNLTEFKLHYINNLKQYKKNLSTFNTYIKTQKLIKKHNFNAINYLTPSISPKTKTSLRYNTNEFYNR